jgi:FixJ family two-component response regulator
MNDPLRQIYLVDDDPMVLKALSRLLRSAGYETATFNSAEAFIREYRADAPGCLILDVSMAGITGLELQQWLLRSNNPLPIIFLTAHGNIPASVQAMKAGAVDFLTKPVNDVDLLKAIQEASRREQQSRAIRAERTAIEAKLATLTPREREVFEHVVSGRLNKQIAGALGTVEKTVKVHRGRVMQKMGVSSIADLVRLAERAGIGTAPRSAAPAPAAQSPQPQK